ncbi:MAG: FkbM family methyltransferase [Gemmataceae bacterium]
MPTPRRVPLPNGRYAYEDTPDSARILYRQVLGYFTPGLPVRPGMTVFDVGANTGLFSLEVLHRTNGTARVVCFEPAPAAFRLMARSLGEQFPGADVRPVSAAVADKPGEATFFYRPLASAMSSLDPADLLPEADVERLTARAAAGDLPDGYREQLPRWLPHLPGPVARWLVRRAFRRAVGRTEPVPCRVTTVAEAVREHGIDRIDLLKVDVEGAEWEALLGVGEAWPRVRSVAVEVHDLANRLSQVRELLSANGLTEVRFDQEEVFRGTSVYSVWATRPR